VYPSFHAYPQRNCTGNIGRTARKSEYSKSCTSFFSLAVLPAQRNAPKIAQPFLLPSDPAVKWRHLVMRTPDFCTVRVRLANAIAASGRGAGFCHFPALDSTEAEQLSGGSHVPLPAGPLLYRLSCLNLKHLADRYPPLMNVWSLSGYLSLFGCNAWTKLHPTALSAFS